MAEKFRHLEAPYSFKAYYSKYPEGYSIFEALLNWLDEVNKMIDVLNLTLDEWSKLKEWINTELVRIAHEQLVEWLNDGTLEELINQVLFNSKLDVTTFNEFLSEYQEFQQDTATAQAQLTTDLNTAKTQLTNDLNAFKSTQNTTNAGFNATLDLVKQRVYDIRAYGMVPGTDISSALQSLINEVSAKGGTIFIPAGTWIIGRSGEDSASGILLKSNVQILGENKATTFISKTNLRHGNGLFYGIDKTNISIRNLTFTTPTPITYKDTTIRLLRCSETIVENVNFTNIKGTALSISSNVYFTIRDLMFYNIDGNELEGSGVGGQCIYAQDLGTGLIENITARQVGDHVIYFDSSSVEENSGGYTLRGIKCFDTGTNGATQGAAINITNNQNGFVLEDVYLERVRTGIRLGNNGDMVAEPKHFLISNVIVKSTTLSSAIYIHNGNPATRTRVYGNVNNVRIMSTGVEGPNYSAFGIRLDRVSNINFDNISIQGTRLDAINIRGCENIAFNNLNTAYVSSQNAGVVNQAINISNVDSVTSQNIIINNITHQRLDTSQKYLGNTAGTIVRIGLANININNERVGLVGVVNITELT